MTEPEIELTLKRSTYGHTSFDLKIRNAQDPKARQAGIKLFDEVSDSVDKYIQQRKIELEAKGLIAPKKKKVHRMTSKTKKVEEQP